MKIKNQLIISHILLALVIIAALFWQVNYLLNKVRDRNISIAEKNILDVSNKNLKLAQKTVTEFGENEVRILAESTANEIAIELSGADLSDYDSLRKNEKFRKSTTRDIITQYGKAGYFDVYDRHAEIIWHNNPDIEGRNYKEWADSFPRMWELVQESLTEPITTGYYSFINEKDETVERFITAVHIPNTEFNLSCVVNIFDYFEPVKKDIEKINEEIKEASAGLISGLTEKIFKKAHIFFLIIIIVSAFLSLIISVKMANLTAKPVLFLRDNVSKLGEGQFDIKADIKGAAEVRDLALNFNKLGGQLKDRIEKLRIETARRQAVESELTIAREIQQSILPRVFPPFPGHDEFELFSLMYPAKEVGGDFYDFFFYDKNTFVMLVGDVSGKGIPAALFMMLSRALIHTIASEIKDPAVVLKKVNNLLVQDNAKSMFVTMVLAYYSIDTNKITYSNAGHLPPLKITKDKKAEEFTTASRAALGVIPDINYEKNEFYLDVNEKFVLYTDGVSEAFNKKKDEFYGTQKFIDYFLKAGNLSVKQDCENVLKNIMDFQGAHQHDDITLSVFKRLR